MTGIAANLQTVRARIAREVQAVEPPVQAVSLLAVSKTFPVEAIREAAAAGQRAFGESYVQEAAPKIEALGELGLEWHFIGPLQANKTRGVAAAFQWVHGVERLRIAQRLSEQRDVHLPPLQVCLQVNVSGEQSKSGVTPEELPELVQAVAALPRLQLRGLMTIPEASDDDALVRSRFARLRALRDELNQRFGLEMDTLSMGMSGDLELAIAEGATIVRVGTAIFGNREADPAA
ncbi:YggS family pyridoxal phosphate-dependent enzyme [Uliginosibacterium sp. H1]|uniref:YggS family pyridoxal phosphate-dependent enzyme n=1 Tax=Uliginosibacterium sp. H1 TaxID=3114757 RepID=UPI002E188213|nr:YggS family pyridoxal phosphate-dependent enzyme [Uliginosibacterium sp. H1]